MSDSEIKDFPPDRVPVNQIVAEVMKLLAHSEDAAYTVFLKLACSYGAGQGI